MPAPRRYDRDEERALRAELERGGRATCPRCSSALERRAVPPPEGVAYVRDRDWYVCGACGGTLVVDRPRSARHRPPDGSLD